MFLFFFDYSEAINAVLHLCIKKCRNRSLQFQALQLGDDLLLSLVEEQLLIVGEVFLAAAAADEPRHSC